MKRGVLIASALITIVNAAEAFYDHRTLWIRSTMTLGRLYDVRDRFEFYLAGRPPGAVQERDLARFASELQQIRQEHLGSWSRSPQVERGNANETARSGSTH